MLWSLGIFGTSSDAIRRALVFGTSGVLFFATTLYMMGWALQGFVVRKKAQANDDIPAGRRPSSVRGPTAPIRGTKPA